MTCFPKPLQRPLIGVALGKPHEPVGIVRLIREETIGALDAKRGRYEVDTFLEVADVRTLPRGDHYGEVAEAILETAKSFRSFPLLVDIAVCGRAALPPLRERGLKPIPIVTTDAVGSRAKNRLAFEVGRAELRSAMLVALEQGRLAFNQRELASQMAAHTGTKPKRPGDFEEEVRFELATALALCVWWSEFRMPPKIEQPRLPAMQIEIRPPTFSEVMAWARR